jgi:glutathione S-transferase
MDTRATRLDIPCLETFEHVTLPDCRPIVTPGERRINKAKRGNAMSAHDLTLWGHNSGRAMRVLWMLEEFDLGYAHHPVGARTGETKTDEYSRLNPKQKIPTLRHCDLVLTESPAIIAYLADAFDPPAGFYAPRDPAGRAKVNEWVVFVAMELDAHSLYVIRRHDALSDIYGEAPEAVASAREYYLKQLNAVVPRVKSAGTYLFGGDFSIADIMLMTVLDWGRMYGIGLPPALGAYQHRVGERPAYMRAFERNYTDRTIEDVR